MLAVQQEFNERMRAPVRQVYGKVQIDFTDPYLDQSINVETNGNANTSYPSQVADNIETPGAKWASLDGSWILNNTYALAPTENESRFNQMGWWGNKLSGVNGLFTEPYPKLTAIFFARPVKNLKVVGDDKRVEYPINFTITLFDNEDNELYKEIVTGNNGIKWQKDIEQVSNVTKMSLEITRWSEANRQVKILEFFTSIQAVYEGEDIISIHLLEEREVSGGSLPVGNISSNEISIKLSNIDRKFDVGNKQSNIYGLIRANRRINLWLGIGLTTLTWLDIAPIYEKWSDIDGE